VTDLESTASDVRIKWSQAILPGASDDIDAPPVI